MDSFHCSELDSDMQYFYCICKDFFFTFIYLIFIYFGFLVPSYLRSDCAEMRIRILVFWSDPFFCFLEGLDPVFVENRLSKTPLKPVAVNFFFFIFW